MKRNVSRTGIQEQKLSGLPVVVVAANGQHHKYLTVFFSRLQASVSEACFIIFLEASAGQVDSFHLPPTAAAFLTLHKDVDVNTLQQGHAYLFSAGNSAGNQLFPHYQRHAKTHNDIKLMFVLLPGIGDQLAAMLASFGTGPNLMLFTGNKRWWHQQHLFSHGGNGHVSIGKAIETITRFVKLPLGKTVAQPLHANTLLPEPEQANRLELSAMVDLMILQDFSPVVVVTNANMDIIYSRGNTHLYFEGDATTGHIIEHIRPALALDLRNALQQVSASGRRLRKGGIAMVVDGKQYLGGFDVVPVKNTSALLLMVVFEAQAMPGNTQKPRITGDRRIKQLEKEMLTLVEEMNRLLKSSTGDA